jgi:uncharacterized C2H2 Zn-finger protein
MKKTTTQKNPGPQQKNLKCPHCGKSFQNSQGLSAHIRYQHTSQKAHTTTAQPGTRRKAKVGAPAPATNTGAHEHLKAAFAVLNQRDGEIDQEITRLEALKTEKEIVRRELDAVTAALKVFGERGVEGYEEEETERGKGDTPLDTQDAVAAKADRTPEFTGNKTEFVRALVQSRGSVGAAPKDIDQVFAERGIEKSKNAIYNALVSLVGQKKLKKKDGHYFYVESPVKLSGVSS